MDIVIKENLLRDPALVGNKAATLALLTSAGFDIPPFFVIDSQALMSASEESKIEPAIAIALCAICDRDSKVAVRSSSVEEDGAQSSFAGQFESFLFVEQHRIPEIAMRVIASADGDHIETYRDATGQSASGKPPAVLVQKMIDADAAGVAFAADPVTGDTNFAVIAATSGTGDALVSGETQGDTWRIDRKGKITERTTDGDAPVLNDRQIRRVAGLACAVSDHLGRPQDIEWALKDNRLYLLQSRDITILGAGQPEEAYALWDNSNIVESYGGVTTPLTFSVARSAYQEAYRHLGRVLGVSETAIVKNERAYEQMIGLIQGRVYYNLLNWYRLLMLTPGFRFNRRFMEQMMGVTEGLPADAVPIPASREAFASLRASLGLVRVAGRLTKKLVTHNHEVRRFHNTLDRVLEPVDLGSLSLDALIDYYESLQTKVISAWDTPLVNDLYCMIFHGALRQLTERWMNEELADIHNELVAGEAGIISLEPVKRMKEMATIASAEPDFVRDLCDAPLDILRERVKRNQVFYQTYVAYVEKFGDRCLDELKLESATLNDDPMPLLRAVGQLAKYPRRVAPGADQRLAAEEKMNAALKGSPAKRLCYRLTLRMARSRVRDRENLRFERTRVYGRVRTIFMEIGKRLQKQAAIANCDDIFYLDVAEITGFIRGTGVTGNLSLLIRSRKTEFAEYAASEDPPRRFLTCGPAQLTASLRELPDSVTEIGGDFREGQACSPGIVRGPVRIVRDPRNTDFRHGEILVAERTDPGWVTIFPLVTGMIMERGSLLSHSAIVARELGIPAVVGVQNACSWLENGDWVELDGATGTIRVIQPVDRAA